MDEGGNCGKDNLNIWELDPTKFLSAGDSAACKSGQCTCGVCTGSSRKVANGARCSANSDCASNYCKNGSSKTSLNCAGTCMAKLNPGGDCSKSALNIHDADPTKLHTSGDDNACTSGKCMCGRCTDSSRKLPDNGKCSANRYFPLDTYICLL